jgi:predicted metal-dependent peptidase
MDTQRKFAKARTELVLDHPFFGTLLLRQRMEEKAGETKTMAADGARIFYNLEYVERLSLEELKGVLAHVILHVALLHHTRRDGRHQALWNKACDYAVNAILLKAGFKLPQPYLHKPEYEGLSAEAIYARIQEESPSEKIEEGEEELPEEAQTGVVLDAGSPTDPTGRIKASQAEKEEIESEMKVQVRQAAQAAAGVGNIPEGLLLAIDELVEPRIPWREKMSRFLAETARNDYSWTTPNRRYIYHGLYLPALAHPELNNVVVMLDTSGSVSREQLTMMASEVMELLAMYQSDPEILFLYIENEVAGHQFISAMEFPENFEPVGGGGTDFRPGFEWLEEEGILPSVVIYFTDGMAYHFPEEPDYPVIWVLTRKNTMFENPFGEIVCMEEEAHPAGGLSRSDN